MRKLNSRLGYFVVVKLTAIVRAMFVASMLYLLPGTSTAYALDIVAITMDSFRIPYLLDEHGDVWAFKKAQTLEEPFRLPNLHHITQLAPYIALDDKGHVFTWGLHLKTSWDETGRAEKPEYLLPKRVEGLEGAIKIASSGDQFFAAVVGNKGIYYWMSEMDDSSFSNYSLSTGPISKLSPRTDVIDMRIGWTPELLSNEGSVVRPLTKSMLVLFKDGDVQGWGVDDFGLILSGSDMQKAKLIARLPGATEIADAGLHTVILTATGVPKYWGGCDRQEGKDFYRKLVGASGHIADVQHMYINQFSNNSSPSAFVQKDGSVWLAYAPIPPDATRLECGRANKQADVQPLQLDGGAVKQIEMAGEFALILDGNHQLWTWDDRAKRLEQVLLNLK